MTALQGVLQRYEELYDRLDADAASAIWPQVDSRALAKVFERLERQDLNFDGCVFAVSDLRATAQCTGVLSYVPRIGSGKLRTEHHAWTIEFQRAGAAWQILRVSGR